MKVVYISEALLPSESANSIAITNMCYGMSLAGYKVELIAVAGVEKDIYDYYSIKPNDNLKITLVKKVDNFRMQKLFILAKSISVIKNADVIYTRWNYAAALGNFFRKKTMIEFHGMSSLKKNIEMDKRVVASDYTTKVVCITDSLKEDYIKLTGHEDKFVVEAGATQIASGEQKNFIPECGYIGSFHEGKGIELVLEIAAKMPEIVFHVVGGSEKDHKRIKANFNVGKNVILYGYRPYHEAMKIMDKFGIALLPNQKSVVVGGKDIGKYTSPNKMFEYMAKGKVLVASDIEVLKEVLVNRKNALLANPQDIEAWVSAITEVIGAPEMQKQLSYNGQVCVREKYNWVKRAERILGTGTNEG